MKIVKYIFVSVAALSLLAGAAFADSFQSQKEKPKAFLAVGETASNETIPTTPLRYTVNYAAGCDQVTGKGGTVISVINRRPYTTIPTLTYVRIKFYNHAGQVAGDTGIWNISSPNFGESSKMLTLATRYEWDLNTTLFPWIDFAAINPASLLDMSCDYHGYAEIYSSHSAIQVAAFGVSGTGNVTELPVRRTKLPTVGGH